LYFRRCGIFPFKAGVVKPLDVESEMYYIALVHDVVFSFQSPFPCVFTALFSIVFNEVIIGHDFGPDKAFFKVCVNFPGGFWGCVTHSNGPGSDFLYASGEVGLEFEQVVASVDYAVQSRLIKPKFL